MLEEPVRGNGKLYRGMLLKGDFIGSYTSAAKARRFLDGWLHHATYSMLDPIKKVARMTRTHLDGVLGLIQWQISNGRLEGINNRIPLLRHRCFGTIIAETHDVEQAP